MPSRESYFDASLIASRTSSSVGRKIGTQLRSMGEQDVFEDTKLRQHPLPSYPPLTHCPGGTAAGSASARRRLRTRRGIRLMQIA